MGDKWESVMLTPEAVRPPAMAGGRPGEGAIGARRMSTGRRPPTKRQEAKEPTRWSRVGATASLVPWAALVGCSCVLAGLVIFMFHGQTAAQHSRQVLDLVQAATHGYPHLLHIYSASYLVTAGLAGECVLASAFLATVRIRQKIMKRGNRKEWGSCTAGVLSYLSVLAMVAIVLPSIWFLSNAVFLSAWASGMWALQESTTAAGVNMVRWSAETCFNLSYFSWLESSACLCSQQLIAALHTEAREAANSLIWALAGTGCLLLGSLVAAMQAGADVALLGADQALIAMSRRRQSSTSWTIEHGKHPQKLSLQASTYARSPAYME